MIRFSDTFCEPGLVFRPVTETVSASGVVKLAVTPAASGVPVAGNQQSQPGVDKTTTKEGDEIYSSRIIICLLDDPSALNGGKGVRRGDAFSWPADGRTAVAQGDANRVRSLWRVECLVTQ